MSYETFAQRLASAMAGQGMKQVDLGLPPDAA